MAVDKEVKAHQKSLKQLNKYHFKNILTEAEKDRVSSAQTQKELHDNPINVYL